MRWWLSVFCWFYLGVSLAQAQTATSSSYRFESGDFSGVNFDGESANFAISGGMNGLITSAYGQFLASERGMFPMMFQANGPVTQADELPALAINIDKLEVDFPGLTPGIFVENETQILINSNTPAGYSLYAQQNHPLQTIPSEGVTQLQEREILPNTTCDNGLCTINVAGTWDNQSVSGFGLTVLGADGASDFENGLAYRPLATATLNQEPVIIAQDLQTSQLLANRVVQVKYRVGATTSNVAGQYTNAVSYTLVPNF